MTINWTLVWVIAAAMVLGAVGAYIGRKDFLKTPASLFGLAVVVGLITLVARFWIADGAFWKVPMWELGYAAAASGASVPAAIVVLVICSIKKW